MKTVKNRGKNLKSAERIMLLTLLPITIDSSAPYASSSRLIVSTVIGLAAYGWHTALADRPLFGVLFPQESGRRV